MDKLYIDVTVCIGRTQYSYSANQGESSIRLEINGDQLPAGIGAAVLSMSTGMLETAMDDLLLKEAEQEEESEQENG